MNENELLQTVSQNKRLLELGLVILTEGNVSQKHDSVMAIKPSGVPYDMLTPDSLVIVGIVSGRIMVSNSRIPSVDTPIHLEIYRKFPEVGGIAHTHSLHATAFAQAGIEIQCIGTTHADAFNRAIPVTRELSFEEIERDYERNVGVSIAEILKPAFSPAVLVRGHGPFTFGKDAKEAVDNALILEKVAQLALLTRMCGGSHLFQSALYEKHFLRKHGKEASYGQPA